MLVPPSNFEITQRVAARWRAGDPPAESVDDVAVEAPLQIRVDGEEVATVLRTPGADEVLALGFLLSEGVLDGLQQVGAVMRCSSQPHVSTDVIDVRSAPGKRLDVEDRVIEGHAARSAAQSAGGARLPDGVIARLAPLPTDDVQLPVSLIWQAVSSLRQLRRSSSRDDGMHTAAAFDRSGALLAVGEDVGRHNAVDKTLGMLLRRGLLPRAVVLTTSGRAGCEIVQKAVAARIPVVAAMSAASSLAIDLAHAAGVTLAGLVCPPSLNVYTHPHRIGGEHDT